MKSIKTLYISDLDGTLLNKQAELSEYTVKHLNYIIENGINFSVATARTLATCEQILENVSVNVPIILMNGVLVYDIQNKAYIKKEILHQNKVSEIYDAISATGVSGFMYTLNGNRLATFYESVSNNAMKEFIDERVKKFSKPFYKITNFKEVQSDIIYFTFIENFDNIHRLYNCIKDIKGLRIEKYQDIYSNEGLWYMEVFADTASKYNAVKFLKETYGYDRIVAFGDNLNDIPMFEASDLCFAVANAKDAVKSLADEVIGSNVENGVVTQIEKIENINTLCFLRRV